MYASRIFRQQSTEQGGKDYYNFQHA